MRHFQVTGERSPILRMRHTGSHTLAFQGLQCPTSVFTAGCQLTDGVCHKPPLAEFALERRLGATCALNGLKRKAAWTKSAASDR